jgi:hypothetical protein
MRVLNATTYDENVNVLSMLNEFLIVAGLTKDSVDANEVLIDNSFVTAPKRSGPYILVLEQEINIHVIKSSHIPSILAAERRRASAPTVVGSCPTTAPGGQSLTASSR